MHKIRDKSVSFLQISGLFSILQVFLPFYVVYRQSGGCKILSRYFIKNALNTKDTGPSDPSLLIRRLQYIISVVASSQVYKTNSVVASNILFNSHWYGISPFENWWILTSRLNMARYVLFSDIPLATYGHVTSILYLFYLFGVLRRFQHCTGHITTGSWKGRGNQYIQFVRVLYCKLPTNGKQLSAFPLEAVLGIEPRPQRWEARVLPLCHRGPYQYFIMC